MSNKINSKGQIAIEHLNIYMIVASVMLLSFSVLYYFDFFNMEKFTAEQCEFGANFLCTEFALQRQDDNKFDLYIKLQNLMNKEIIANNIILENELGEEYVCGNGGTGGVSIICPHEGSNPSWTANPSSDTLVASTGEAWTPTRLCQLEFRECNEESYVGQKEQIIIIFKFKGSDQTLTHLTHNSTGYLSINVG
jgi:hypothetical protein